MFIKVWGKFLWEEQLPLQGEEPIYINEWAPMIQNKYLSKEELRGRFTNIYL